MIVKILFYHVLQIRRLKEQVLQQLPPKRRQIIRMSLKRSDIVSAKTAVGALKTDDSENASEDVPLESFEEHDGIVAKSLLSLY